MSVRCTKLTVATATTRATTTAARTNRSDSRRRRLMPPESGGAGSAAGRPEEERHRTVAVRVERITSATSSVSGSPLASSAASTRASASSRGEARRFDVRCGTGQTGRVEPLGTVAVVALDDAVREDHQRPLVAQVDLE